MRIGERTEVELPGAFFKELFARAVSGHSDAACAAQTGAPRLCRAAGMATRGSPWMTRATCRRGAGWTATRCSWHVLRAACRWLVTDAQDRHPQTETRSRNGESPVTCKRVFRWVRTVCNRDTYPHSSDASASARPQVASDPIWSGDSEDVQVLMKRTVNTDEEEYLFATDERPPPVIKEVVKVRRRTACTERLCVHR